MLGGAFVQTLTGLARLLIFMVPLKAIFLKLSGTEIVHVPKTTFHLNVDTLLYSMAIVLVVANYLVTAIDYFIDSKRRLYASGQKELGNRKRARNVHGFYSIIKSAISFLGLFPVLMYMDLGFTLIIILILFATLPLVVASRRLAANEQRGAFMSAILSSKATGALSLGFIVAAAIVYIASAHDISHEAAIYFLIYFLLLRQLAASVQRASDAFHQIRL
jgi:hypothetical protein